MCAIRKPVNLGGNMNRILIVDDEESMRILYADELTEEGYEVITTADGSRLLELIEQERPDLIVLDIVLGEHSGLDLLQDIRNAYSNLPVIICTAYSTFKYDLRATAADHYVVKSSDIRGLKLKVKGALEGHKQFLATTALNHAEQMPPCWPDTH
jgi:two-component system response regulator (stage 0 sporulation protein F)